MREWANVTTINAREIIDEHPRGLLIDTGIGEPVWVPKHLTVIRDYHRAILDVESWFARLAIQRDASVARNYKNGTYTLEYLKDDLMFEKHKVSVSIADSRDHQKEAFQKAFNLRAFALYMSCRAGKTKACIDIAVNHAMTGTIKQVLWLCPLSVVLTARWQWSVFCQTPKLREKDTLRFFGTDSLSGCRQDRFENLLAWVKSAPTMVVIDESQMIKNSNAQRSKRAEKLAKAANVRCLLSGTPITRNILDIFQQAKTLDWRILGYRNAYQFKKRHIEYSDKYPGLIERTKNEDYIAERLLPFVFEYFPKPEPETYERVTMRMSDKQREWYLEVKSTIIARMENRTDDRNDVYLLFTALQSVLSGEISPRILKRLDVEDWQTPLLLPCPKIESLRRTRGQIDGKVIVWCTRRHEIDAVSRALSDTYIVTGNDKFEARHEIIQRFRNSACGTLVAMIQVAKRGIDAYEADTAIFYGQSFDYESREQAAARIQAPDIKDRICHYIDMIYSDSLDERILTSHGRKESIIKSFLNMLKTDRAKAIEEIKIL